MVNLEDFKRALGKEAEGLADGEIAELNAIFSQLAVAVFDDCYLKPLRRKTSLNSDNFAS